MPDVIPWWQQDWYVQNAYNPDLPPISTPPPSTVNMWSGEAPSGPTATPYPIYTPPNTPTSEWMLPNNPPNYFGGGAAPNLNFGQVDVGPWSEPGALPDPGQGVPSTTASGDYGPGSISDVPGGDIPLLPGSPAGPAPRSPGPGGPLYPNPPSDWGSPTNWQNAGNALGNVAGGIGNFFRGGIGGLPPGFVEGNRFGGGAPTFTGPGFTGPQWTPGGSIFGQLPGVRGGPLSGSFAGLGAGSAGMLTQPWQNFIGTRSPAYLKWMAMRGINRHDATRLFAGSGGPASVSGATQGAQHAGQHISPT